MSEKNTVALNERDSSSLLSSCGVRMVASVLLDKPDRAAFEAASRQLGFPVAMKVLSDDILHKTDVGCVVLNVTDMDGMQAAYDTIMANAAKNAPGARVQGVLAEHTYRYEITGAWLGQPLGAASSGHSRRQFHYRHLSALRVRLQWIRGLGLLQRHGRQLHHRPWRRRYDAALILH